MASESRLRKNRSEDPTESSSNTARSLLSLFLVLHLFCVFVALGSSIAPSPLQLRLLGVLRPYVRVLNFELAYSQYHLTHGTEVDVDARIEVLPADQDGDAPDSWRKLPDVGGRSGERYKRYQRLAKQMARFNQLSTMFPDMGVVVATIAKSTASHFAHHEPFQPVQVRCRQHFLQPMDAISGGNEEQRDPHSATYFRVPYAANVLVDLQGNVDVIKIDAAGEVARPVTGGR